MRKSLTSGETLFALAVMSVGLLVLVIGSDYAIGDFAEPGPGMFPVALGGLLTLLGAGLVVSALGMPAEAIRLPLRPLACVGGAVLVWSLLVDRIGFVPATLALVSLSALAERRIRTGAIAILAIVLSAGGYAIFVYGFGMPFEPFGW